MDQLETGGDFSRWVCWHDVTDSKELIAAEYSEDRMGIIKNKDPSQIDGDFTARVDLKVKELVLDEDGSAAIRTDTSNFMNLASHELSICEDERKDCEDFHTSFERNENLSALDLLAKPDQISSDILNVTRHSSDNTLGDENSRLHSKIVNEELFEEAIIKMGLSTEDTVTKGLNVVIRQHRQPSRSKRRKGKSKRQEKTDEQLMKEILREQKPARDQNIFERADLTILQRIRLVLLDSAVSLARGKSELYNILMLLIIVLAGILVGIDTKTVLSIETARALDW